MPHKDLVIIRKIIDELNIASDIMDGVDYDFFISNEEKKRAICMTVINIGELIKNLSSEFRLSYAYIPWKAIAGFRDIAAHKYRTLRMNDVYSTVINDFPEFLKQLKAIEELEQHI